MNHQRLLTVKQVCSSLNVSRTWLFLARRDGLYPQGVHLTSRCLRFRCDLHEQFVRGEWNGGDI